MQPVEMALEAGLVVMRNGGSTVAADRCFSNVLEGFAAEGVSAVWRLDFIAASKVVGGEASTLVRSVGPVGTNLARVSAATVLGERVARHEVDAAAFANELERIQRLPSPYARWVITLGAAFAAAFFSRTTGGDWGSFGVAFVAAAVGQVLRYRLQARKVVAAPVTLVCGLVSASIAALGLRLGFSQAVPATLIASVIYMIPGLMLINGFVDVLWHKYLLVGFERVLNSAFLFLLLAIAIVFARTFVY